MPDGRPHSLRDVLQQVSSEPQNSVELALQIESLDHALTADQAFRPELGWLAAAQHEVEGDMAIRQLLRRDLLPGHRPDSLPEDLVRMQSKGAVALEDLRG